jgi:putative sterol carrier protein
MADEQAQNGVIGAVDADELARMVAGASDEQIAEGMQSENRKPVLDEIFKRMGEHVDPERAAGAAAVVHWKILDRPDGGHDHYEVVLENGVCKVSDSPGREPRVTFSIGAVDFIRLVSGNASGPTLFMTGKLRIEGDLMFASQMASLFRIPKSTA